LKGKAAEDLIESGIEDHTFGPIFPWRWVDSR